MPALGSNLPKPAARPAVRDFNFGKIAVGGAIAAVIVAALGKVDERLQYWFILITFLTVIIANRDMFFSQLNSAIAVVQGK
jgi:hypothetical protein